MAERCPRPFVSASFAMGRARVRPRSGCWHRPDLLNLISDLLFLFAITGLIYALLAWAGSLPFFPVREVFVTSTPGHVTREQLEHVARSTIRGNFFTIDLDKLRATFERLPWVRQAEVRRRWPDGLELAIEEHQAVAYWGAKEGNTYLIDARGEVFAALSDVSTPLAFGEQEPLMPMAPRDQEPSMLLTRYESHADTTPGQSAGTPSPLSPTMQTGKQDMEIVAPDGEALPVFSGPWGSAPMVLARYETYSNILRPLGARLVELELSARAAWRLRLDNGLTIVLGREREDPTSLETRLAHFVTAWPQLQQRTGIDIVRADLRYPSGFTLTPAEDKEK
ncbi:MAG: cell division protein FtsQ/DivIB [Azoarcus sp.]|nr:cell division protein FtsQ/DivIB [Azoarcus sp.]